MMSKMKKLHFIRILDMIYIMHEHIVMQMMQTMANANGVREYEISKFSPSSRLCESAKIHVR